MFGYLLKTCPFWFTLGEHTHTHRQREHFKQFLMLFFVELTFHFKETIVGIFYGNGYCFLLWGSIDTLSSSIESRLFYDLFLSLSTEYPKSLPQA